MVDIFHSYDIRGKYPKDLNENKIKKLGQSIAQFFNEKDIVVGRDTRLSSPQLHKNLIKGITSQNKNVIDIGLCSTPMFYFASGSLNKNAAMVTASHNPKQYNGIKITRKKAKPVGMGTGLEKIKEMFNNKTFKEKEKGKIAEKNIISNYRKKVRSFIKKKPKLKIIADASNGMAGLTIPKILDDFNIIKLNFKLDGNFPAHPPDPFLPEALKPTQKTVIKENADLGVVFDADGDRVIFIDEKGKNIPGDRIISLIAREILSKRKTSIAYDIRSSKVVPETIKNNNGKPIETKIGHSFIKEKMRKTNARFAGELSGHYYYKELWNAENGLVTLIKIANLIEKTGKTLSELVKPLNKYYQSGEINFSVKNKDSVINKIEQKYKSKAKNISHLDGITMEFEDWWFNLRKSGTEPVIRLNLEAKTRKLQEEKTKELKQFTENTN